MAQYIKTQSLHSLYSKRPAVSEKDRTCTYPKCKVMLSIYNHDDVCWAHRVKRKPRLRGRKTKQLAVEHRSKCRSCAQRKWRWNSECDPLTIEGVLHHVDLSGKALCDYEDVEES